MTSSAPHFCTDPTYKWFNIKELGRNSKSVYVVAVYYEAIVARRHGLLKNFVPYGNRLHSTHWREFPYVKLCRPIIRYFTLAMSIGSGDRIKAGPAPPPWSCQAVCQINILSQPATIPFQIFHNLAPQGPNIIIMVLILDDNFFLRKKIQFVTDLRYSQMP